MLLPSDTFTQILGQFQGTSRLPVPDPTICLGEAVRVDLQQPLAGCYKQFA